MVRISFSLNPLRGQKNPVSESALPTGKFCTTGKFLSKKMAPKTSKKSLVWKYSGQSGKFVDSLESLSLCGQSGKFPDSLEGFRTVCNVFG